MRTKILLVLLVLGLFLATALPVVAAPAATSWGNWHRVSRGETLYSIGRYYNVNPWAIARENGLRNPNRIFVGQHLRIPAGPPYYPGPGHYPPPHGCGSYYIVRYGDTLYRIGRMYGISPWRIAAANGIYNMNHIWAGQSLHIPCH